MGVQNKTPAFVRDRNNKNRKIYHSKNCTWGGYDSRISKYGTCLACDKMRSYKATLDVIPNSAFGLDTESKNSIYCMISQIPYPRCTKVTNPRCGCGKLVYYKEKFEGLDELY